MPLNEFEVIKQFFTRTPKRQDVILGVGDDCAVLQPPKNQNLIMSTDTLNLDVHFLGSHSPEDIGFKSAAVSLSDIASMGGVPAWMLLSLTLPEANPVWLAEFAKGLFACLDQYQVDLVGGNTTKGPLAITTQITGFTPSNQVLTRHTAKPGDHIFVTGFLGTAALALAIQQKRISADLWDTEEIEEILQKLFRPTPRIKAGSVMSSLAQAAIDISDGFLADLGHILERSHVGATVFYHNLPISPYLQRLNQTIIAELVLAGGEDYELCFTIAPDKIPLLQKAIHLLDCKITEVGIIESKLGLRVEQLNGQQSFIVGRGYQHF
jgi:thiamine-monophosphate kinase